MIHIAANLSSHWIKTAVTVTAERGVFSNVEYNTDIAQTLSSLLPPSYISLGGTVLDIKVGSTDCKVSQHSGRYRDDDIYNMFITDITETTITFITNANLLNLG